MLYVKYIQLKNKKNNKGIKSIIRKLLIPTSNPEMVYFIHVFKKLILLPNNTIIFRECFIPLQ